MDERLTGDIKVAIRQRMKGMLHLALIACGLTMLSACVQVAAPDKPIEINLNIRIEQEVVYRIEGAVNDAIEENSEIF